MKNKKIMVVGLMVVLALSPMAHAVLMITNGDFESGTPDSANIDSWFDQDTSAGAAGSVDQPVATYNRYLSGPGTTAALLGDGLDGFGLGGGPAGVGNRYLYQSIGTKEDGVDYSVSFDYAQDFTGFSGPNRAVGIKVDIDQGTFAGATDDVDIEGQGLTLITSFQTPTTSLVDTFVNYNSGVLDLSSANTTDALWIRVSNLPGAGSDNFSMATVDNIQIIPEPATLGLVGLFGAGILFVRRRIMM